VQFRRPVKRSAPGVGAQSACPLQPSVPGCGLRPYPGYALLLFNAYERRQARRDAEEALRVVSAEMRRLERELGVPAVDTRPVRHAPPARIVYPVPPGYRCSGGALLHRAGNSWTQVTARSNHVYCPHVGTVADCYPVTPQSVGCR